MTMFPKRDAYSSWRNPEPFTDIHMALELLAGDSTTTEPVYLQRCQGEDYEWQIVLPWYTHGSSGGDQSGYDYFQIDPVLAKQLVDERLVAIRRILHLGYTEERKDQFVIDRLGKRKVEDFKREMLAKAESMLTPGVHTNLTAEPERRGSSRDQWRYGALHFDFKMPLGGICRVYPEEGRLIVPE